MNRPDRDASLLGLVREAFENSGRRYGYKRVHLELRGMGIRVSAKRVMRLMTRHGLVPLLKRARRYSSYKGEMFLFNCLLRFRCGDESLDSFWL